MKEWLPHMPERGEGDAGVVIDGGVEGLHAGIGMRGEWCDAQSMKDAAPGAICARRAGWLVEKFESSVPREAVQSSWLVFGGSRQSLQLLQWSGVVRQWDEAEWRRAKSLDGGAVFAMPDVVRTRRKSVASFERF